MLLRYFVNFYDMEIIEEEAFLAWKEDITQEFPGKGKALFQVIGFRHLRREHSDSTAGVLGVDYFPPVGIYNWHSSSKHQPCVCNG